MKKIILKRQKSFSETLNKLYLIYINHKYPDYSKENESVQSAILLEMIEFGQNIYMASRNPMINGKNVEILSNKGFLDEYAKLDLNP